MIYMAFFTLSGFTERCWGTFGYKILFLFAAIAMGCQKVDQTADNKTVNKPLFSRA